MLNAADLRRLRVEARDRTSMRPQLQPALELAKTLSADELPTFLGDLEIVRITALARIVAPAAEVRPDELLDVEQTAKANAPLDELSVPPPRAPSVRAACRPKLLFSSSGLDQYLRKTDSGRNSKLHRIKSGDVLYDVRIA